MALMLLSVAYGSADHSWIDGMYFNQFLSFLNVNPFLLNREGAKKLR